MRIAAFNVENLFDRPRAFNDHEPPERRQALDDHAALNNLFERATYSDAAKAKMLELMERQGILNDDDGRFVRIRKVRGQLIRRPRDRNKPRMIVADGRDDWVGWCELKTAPVNEIAIQNTGRVMRDLDADILAIVEAESRPVLAEMNKFILNDVGGTPYPQIMVIDGNDRRGIDVGIMTKEGFEIGAMRSHVHDLNDAGEEIFSRDCPEYEITTPSGNRVWVIPNHFKSKFGGNDPVSQNRRENQARRTAEIYQSLKDAGEEFIVVLGDLNDVPDSGPLQPLLSTELRDVSEHNNFTDFEFRANNGNKGVGTYNLGNDSDKIDYLLLSPALFDRVTNAGLFRKGAWPGSSPKRWEVYDELLEKLHVASDHHAIFADLDI